jgi:hypothetical protein
MTSTVVSLLLFRCKGEEQSTIISAFREPNTERESLDQYRPAVTLSSYWPKKRIKKDETIFFRRLDSVRELIQYRINKI